MSAAKLYGICMFVCFLWVLFGLPQADNLVFVILILYPSFKTVLSVEGKSDEERKQWLAYWALAGGMISLEYSPVGILL